MWSFDKLDKTVLDEVVECLEAFAHLSFIELEPLSIQSHCLALPGRESLDTCVFYISV